MRVLASQIIVGYFGHHPRLLIVKSWQLSILTVMRGALLRISDVSAREDWRNIVNVRGL